MKSFSLFRSIHFCLFCYFSKYKISFHLFDNYSTMVAFVFHILFIPKPFYCISYGTKTSFYIRDLPSVTIEKKLNFRELKKESSIARIILHGCSFSLSPSKIIKKILKISIYSGLFRMPDLISAIVIISNTKLNKIGAL